MRRSVLAAALAAALWAPTAAADPTLAVDGPASPTNQTSATLSFSSDAPDGVFECRLDEEPWQPFCLSPGEAAGLGDGQHTFRVRVTSLLTGTAEAEHSWTVDTQAPPTPTITSGPSGLVDESTATFEFAAAEGPQCSLDGGGFTACTSGVAYAGLADGAHSFAVRATDAAGNASGADTRSWTVDTTPPVATIGSGPPPLTQSRAANFTFSSEPGAVLRCRRDGAAFAVCTSPEGYTGLADGGHVFQVRAVDAAGNLGAIDSHAWTIDGTDPGVSIGSGPSGPTASRAATFGFSVNETAAVSCKLDDGGYGACASPVAFTELADGPHTVTVRAVDGAGNVGTGSRSWSVDATPPVLTVPASKVAEADAPSGAKVVYTVGGSDGGSALLPGAIQCSPPSGTRFPLGTTTATCSAEDALGNEASADFEVTVRDTTPPAINAPDVSVTATFAGGARRSDQAVAAYLAGVRAIDLVSSATLANDAPDVLPVGQSRVVFTARDAAGNQASKRVTVTVLPQGSPAPPPDFTPPADVRRARALAGDHRVTITWAPPARDFAYAVVQRFGAGGSGRAVTSYRGTARRHVVKGLRNDVQYRFLIVAYDRAGNRSRGVVVVATPTARLLARPRQGARLTRPPELRWAPVGGASYFNVQLWWRGRKILSAWPVQARLQLRSTWLHEGRRMRLIPGVYTWYVWPGIGAKSAARYGTLLGKSTFVIVPDPRL